MQLKSIQLNKDKTETIVLGNKNERKKLFISQLNSRAIETKPQLRNLGVFIESDLSFTSHIKAITKSAFYHLKQIAKDRAVMCRQEG